MAATLDLVALVPFGPTGAVSSRRRRFACPASVSVVTDEPAAAAEVTRMERSAVRLGLASKGRLSEESLSLLKNCQLKVRQLNPRQYTADIPQIDNLEVWFQRPKDIVRKLLTGDLDIGIVGLDTVCEYGQGNEDLIVVHDDLRFGACRLSLAIPKDGIFENINSLDELARMSQWTAARPLRVATGFSYLGPKFFKEKGLKSVTFSSADGALESCPAMGIADAIVDLVSSGTTLRENNLKEIEGGLILQSQAVFVASKRSLNTRKGVLKITYEMLERFEAHLVATQDIMVTANMKGDSGEEVARRVLSQTSLCGLQGPTVSEVYSLRDGKVTADHYAINIVVPQKSLYEAIQQLRDIGGRGVLVSGITYVFDEEPARCKILRSRVDLRQAWEMF